LQLERLSHPRLERFSAPQSWIDLGIVQKIGDRDWNLVCPSVAIAILQKFSENFLPFVKILWNMSLRGDAFEMMNTSNFKQRANGNSKYSIEPLNCSYLHHANMENFMFEINQVMPVHNYGENFRFVEGCLYVLPKCYPIVDYALLYQGNLILFQVSVMSLADHQEKKRRSTKQLIDLTNDQLKGMLEYFKIELPKKKGESKLYRYN